MKIFLTLIIPLFIRLTSFSQTSGVITVHGDINKFYPVTWQDGGWNSSAATILNIGRADIHTNVANRGSLISKFTYHASNWGHFSNFIDAEIAQMYNTFIGGWDDASRDNSTYNIVVWLKGGGTSYTFSSNYASNPVVYDGVANALPFAETNGPSRTSKTTPDSYVNSYGGTKNGSIYVTSTNPNYFAGNVSIGTQNSQGYKLAVAGNFIAESVKVKTQSAWPDYVFSKDYQLPSLYETERYIKENSRLWGIPSAQEIAKEGFDLGQMDAKLLQKIEELTLYVIELKKENDKMKETLAKMNKN